MQLVLEKRAERSNMIALVSPLIAIGLTIVTMIILFAILGKNPLLALQAYFIAPYQYQRRLISNSVRWAAAGNAPPITVDAPLCVQAAFYTQDNPQRTLIHLLNEVNTQANRAIPENNPPQREEILPVLDIKIRAAPGFTRAFQEPGHHLLQLKQRPQWSEIMVPRLDVHSIIVLEK